MTAFGADLSLSPTQTDLLIAALNSNQPQHKSQPSTMPQSKRDSQGANVSPTTSANRSAVAPGSGRLEYEDSPFIDYLDGEGDESFNFDENDDLFGDLPDDHATGNTNSTTDPEHLHDKRKSMGGGDDSDEDDDEGGGKRREGEDKQSKKPGRKPLMSEPTTKRKAQNRAAQRAFRERKEKHLKDLETTVEEYKKASESTSQENALLKAKVERMEVELKEYRKRLSWISGNVARTPSNASWNRNNANTNPTGSSDFQFQFPKFGDSSNSNGSPNSSLNGSQNFLQAPRASTLPVQQTGSSLLNSVGRPLVPSQSSHGVNSRHNSSSASPTTNTMTSPVNNNNLQLNNIDSFSGLFSPSILEATRNSPSSYFGIDQGSTQTPIRGSLDNGSYSSIPGLYSGSSVSNTESPGSLSDPQNHLSSIGTSPDPLFNSPNNKVQDFGLNTINEEGNLGQWNFSTAGAPEFDPSGFNMLARQNGGGFDPVLFGDYRDTTDNLLSQDFGAFFNDAYPLPELGSPNHNYSDMSNTTNTQTNEMNKVPDLMARVDAAKNSDMSRPAEAPKLLTCNKIWDRLQSMEKFRNGEIDIDNLCSELRAKAKCSEGGAVVEEKHVNRILGL